MVFTINLTTLIAICTALTFAGAAAVWALRVYAMLRRLPGLITMVQGDPESDDPEARDGHVRRITDAETTIEAHGKMWRAFLRALRIPPTSDEHEIAEAIRVAIREGRIVEQTGPHQVVTHTALPQHGTRYREPIPREDPETPRKR